MQNQNNGFCTPTDGPTTTRGLHIPLNVRNAFMLGARTPQRVPNYMDTPTSPREIRWNNSPFSPTYQYWEPEVTRIGYNAPNRRFINRWGVPQPQFDRIFPTYRPPRPLPMSSLAAPPRGTAINTPPPPPPGVPVAARPQLSRVRNTPTTSRLPFRNTPVAQRLGSGRQMSPVQIGVSPNGQPLMMTPLGPPPPRPRGPTRRQHPYAPNWQELGYSSPFEASLFWTSPPRQDILSKGSTPVIEPGEIVQATPPAPSPSSQASARFEASLLASSPRKWHPLLDLPAPEMSFPNSGQMQDIPLRTHSPGYIPQAPLSPEAMGLGSQFGDIPLDSVSPLASPLDLSRHAGSPPFQSPSYTPPGNPPYMPAAEPLLPRVGASSCPPPTMAFATTPYMQNLMGNTPPRAATGPQRSGVKCAPMTRSTCVRNLFGASGLPPTPPPMSGLFSGSPPGQVGGNPEASFPVPPISIRNSPSPPGVNTNQVSSGQGQGAGSPGQANSPVSISLSSPAGTASPNQPLNGSPGNVSGGLGSGGQGLDGTQPGVNESSGLSPSPVKTPRQSPAPSPPWNGPPKVPTPPGGWNVQGTSGDGGTDFAAAGTGEATDIAEEDGFLTIEFGGLDELDCFGA